MTEPEQFVCRKCYRIGPLTVRGTCEGCGSDEVSSMEAINAAGPKRGTVIPVVHWLRRRDEVLEEIAANIDQVIGRFHTGCFEIAVQGPKPAPTVQ